jgi:DNA-binding transcriptional LysR family regulator
MVSDLGSMTAAAKALFIAQPTVSQAIIELEDYYGIKLFDRLSKRLFITEKGRQLLSYARHITALVNEMDQVMKNPDESGMIKIGASLTIGTYLLPKLVNEFAKYYPLLQVKAITKNTQEIEALLMQNDIDFAVVEGVVHNPDIITTAFMDDELLLVCGRAYPLYKRARISIADMRNLHFIVREQGSGTRELFENIMDLREINWHLAWECNGSDVLKSAAINGVGVAVISQRLVENEMKTGELWSIKVEDIELKRKFSVIYHKNKYITDAMKAFIDLCFQESKNII